MPHIVLFTQHIRSEPRSTGITNILLALVGFIKVVRHRTVCREQVDLKDQTATAWIIIHHVLQWRVGIESAVPILLAVDLNWWKRGRERAASHNMLRTDCDLLTVEVGKPRGSHVDRTDAQSHVFRTVDTIEIGIPL